MMKKLIWTIISFSSLLCTSYAQTSINIMENVVFYDGYASVVDDTLPIGVFRFRNDLVTKKITQNELDLIGSTLTLEVTIGALCDNYDRIGNVNLAFVPKGDTLYNIDSVNRMELGRFITPFMNKNIMPDTVPYSYDISNVAKILKSQEIQNQYDFWLELELFGVPYAANTQVAGCSGRSDVFKGKVVLQTNANTNIDYQTFIDPIAIKHTFNNYTADGTDTAGTTVKSFQIELSSTVYDAKIFLITSNHGAGNGGEEYVRRWHYVFFDGDTVMTYQPGGKSCEPYRVYNTQSNGIYGTSAHSESWWTSWNNWCPGDAIPIREIDLGNLNAGTHIFTIKVPDATFTGNDGNFPLSLYLQGDKTEPLSLGSYNLGEVYLFPNPAQSIVEVSLPEGGQELQFLNIYDISGKLIAQSSDVTIDVSGLQNGIYVAHIQLKNGNNIARRFTKI